MLARAIGKTDLTVNSVHFQGIGRLAEGLAVEALAPDGLVEAYSARPNGAPLLAVQWHPEWDATDNPESAAFFRLLGQALRGEA
jgi:putative glutamine amidotransferase